MFSVLQCPACGAPGAVPCHECRACLEPAPELAVPANLDACYALVAYDGPAEALIRSAKYGRHRDGLRWLARGLAALARDLDLGGPITVTWVPATRAHTRARGFDPGHMLARPVARALGCRARPTLVRHPGPAQTDRALAERRAGPGLASRALRIEGRVIVLVDDVVTSGASMAAAGAILRAKGASAVVGLSAARTPVGRDRHRSDRAN